MHQEGKLFKSTCKSAWELEFVNGKQSFTSLAYIITWQERTTWGKSFMKIPRRRGPRWLSCGTPEVTWTRLEIELKKLRFDKYVEIHSVNVIGNPNSISFFNYSWWFTESKISLIIVFKSASDDWSKFVLKSHAESGTLRHWCCSWAVISWSIHLLIALCFAISR